MPLGSLYSSRIALLIRYTKIEKRKVKIMTCSPRLGRYFKTQIFLKLTYKTLVFSLLSINLLGDPLDIT